MTPRHQRLTHLIHRQLRDRARPHTHAHELQSPIQTGDPTIDPQLEAYYDQLAALAEQAAAGTIPQSTFEERAQEIVFAAILLAFLLGGGNPETMNARATIDRHKATAQASITDISNAIYSGRYGEIERETFDEAAGEMVTKVVQSEQKGREMLLGRLALWAVTLANIYQVGKVHQPATVNGAGERVEPRKRWRRGATVRPCRECLALDGVVLTVSEWQYLEQQGLYPGSYSLGCRGFECRCEFRDTEAESIGLDSVLAMLGV